jgi:hypothetical protein
MFFTLSPGITKIELFSSGNFRSHLPLEAAHFIFAASRIHLVPRHPQEVIRQFPKQNLLLLD